MTPDGDKLLYLWMERQETAITTLIEQVSELRADVARLQVRSSLWGAAAGIIAGVLANIFTPKQ